VFKQLQHVPRVFGHLIESMLSVVGIHAGTEEPIHSVEPLTDGVQIRRYGPRIAAETTVAGDEASARSAGFRRLAGYIFGANHRDETIAMTAPVGWQPDRRDGQQIAMTAPVAQSAGSEQNWVIRFYMPAKWTMESLPQPNNPAVQLVTFPAETLAVRRFSGGRSPGAIASQTAALMRTVRETGFEPIGTPAAWFYDPPWTVPMLRRNEIAVPVNPNP
jgi:hypothetical protein